MNVTARNLLAALNKNHPHPPVKRRDDRFQELMHTLIAGGVIQGVEIEEAMIIVQAFRLAQSKRDISEYSGCVSRDHRDTHSQYIHMHDGCD